ncbi:MAG TPA: CheR family methyltransferase, partial [Kofleriaceae bacterium]|nr:CheR family methyltransferase [Kofleriaceae bacterium]
LSASKIGVVDVASSGADIQPDRVFVLSGSGTPRYKGGQLSVDATRHTPAPVDAILRSVADEAGRFGVGILLGSTTADGILGMQRMKESGGLTIVERVAGATNGHARQGLIDLVLPVDDIAPQLVAFVRSDEQRLLADVEDHRDGGVDMLRDILNLVRQRTGHDFGAYKRATLSRRIARRMQVCGCESVIDYREYVREHSGELHSLLRDFLISVTNFFRDTEAFLHLQSEVVPRLFANKSASDQVRVWVAGCATGEEAYSIAMLLHEHAATLRSPPQLLVFATDIDEIALATARLGCYPETIAADMTTDRLERFFTRENGQYRVTKELRETVMFSPHNLLRDPPFSRLDLISCRNLLIYLNRDAQNRLLSVFHFGLRPEGLLFLGSSESAENSQLFGPLDGRHRVFVRRMASLSLGDTISSTGRWAPTAPPAARPHTERVTRVGELHHRIVELYAPPSVLVNSELDVLHLSEHAGKYLVVSGGEPTRHLLQLVHPAFGLDLRTALHAARQTGSETRVVRFDDNGAARAVEIRVRSVKSPELGDGSFLVMFDELVPDGRPSQAASIEPVVREMEDELHRTRDQLRTTVEQYETSLEELKASNEELQAINEELRSATEELETGKEELQSVNEELSALNHELKVNVEELSHANADLQNLMSSTDIAVLFVDRALNLKR